MVGGTEGAIKVAENEAQRRQKTKDREKPADCDHEESLIRGRGRAGDSLPFLVVSKGLRKRLSLGRPKDRASTTVGPPNAQGGCRRDMPPSPSSRRVHPGECGVELVGRQQAAEVEELAGVDEVVQFHGFVVAV